MMNIPAKFSGLCKIHFIQQNPLRRLINVAFWPVDTSLTSGKQMLKYENENSNRKCIVKQRNALKPTDIRIFPSIYNFEIARKYYHTVVGNSPFINTAVKNYKCISFRMSIYDLSEKHLCARFSTMWHSFPNDFCKRITQVNTLKGLRVCELYSTDRPESVEKKLMKLMDMWEVEKAVRLVNDSVKNGIIPHQNIVLNLLQQIANLGEYECLLELHSFLLDHKLCTDVKFFECLNQAYYNSGRVDEGVQVLRLIYHKTRKFQDVDVFFTLLTVMVLRHFPDRLQLVQQFVDDLKNAEKPVVLPEAALWKCFMLAEKFEDAENLLLKSEEIQPYLPQMVSDICTRKNQIDCNYNAILPRLLDVPNLKQKLRILVLESHAFSLYEAGKLEECLQVIKTAKSRSLLLHPVKIRPLLQAVGENCNSEEQQALIKELTVWLDSHE